MRFVGQKPGIVAVCATLLLAFYPGQTLAQKKSRLQDASRHSREAAEVFTQIMNIKEKAIPKELIDKAEAIAVFPDVIKAAFVFGGRGGQGVISRRIRGGWTDLPFSISAAAALARRSCAKDRLRFADNE